MEEHEPDRLKRGARIRQSIGGDAVGRVANPAAGIKMDQRFGAGDQRFGAGDQRFGGAAGFAGAVRESKVFPRRDSIFDRAADGNGGANPMAAGAGFNERAVAAGGQVEKPLQIAEPQVHREEEDQVLVYLTFFFVFDGR